jgi:hypothetical protein
MSGSGGDSTGKGHEKRAYTRLPLRLEARLFGPSWAERSGQIRDFCPGGVFFACAPGTGDPSEEARAASDPLATVTVRFTLGAGSEHAVAARVARALGSGLGLSFVDPGAEIIAALQAEAERQLEQSRPATRGESSLPAGSNRDPTWYMTWTETTGVPASLCTMSRSPLSSRRSRRGKRSTRGSVTYPPAR